VMADMLPTFEKLGERPCLSEEDKEDHPH